MPQPWLKDIKRRSVEMDYQYYDPPRIIYKKIQRDPWPYKTHIEYYTLRDRALMCLLYLTCARITEVTRGRVRVGMTTGITKGQFAYLDDFIMVRNLPIFKRKFVQRGGKWSSVDSITDYPHRIELPLPLKGDLSLFTLEIHNYLQYLRDDEELFKFLRYRGFKIIRRVTGEFPHYFRSMGLKMWLRLFSNDLVRLQSFSGHRQIQGLARYLSTSWFESRDDILKFKMQNHKEKLR